MSGREPRPFDMECRGCGMVNPPPGHYCRPPGAIAGIALPVVLFLAGIGAWIVVLAR